jgi:tetratricopeptide (TPR) repeat protein
MKPWVCTALMLVTMLGFCRAEAIHLKNGTIISADKVTEKDGEVNYTVGSTKYSVPKSAVSSIEHSATIGISIGTSQSGSIAPPVDSGSSLPASSANQGGNHRVSHSQLAAVLPRAPQMRSVDSAALYAQIVSSSRVSERALYDIEAEGNLSKSSAAYFIAAQYAYNHGDAEAARKYMRRCVEFEPEQAALREWYSVLLLDGGQHQEAVAQAEHAVQRAPNSAETLFILGLAYYDSGRFTEAIENWKHAQALNPSEAITQYLEKAEREAAIEGNFSEHEGAHFALRYEGRKAGFRFASELLSSLDRQYVELQRELGFSPDSTITVILYTEQQFFDVTQAPSWSRGLNDGKVRIPVGDLSGITPQLESVLRHEIAHSFIHELTRGRCPSWLDEGIAQMAEPRSSSAFAADLEQLFRERKYAPLRYLEGSFHRFSPEQASLSYAESLAATEYLRSAYGMPSVRRMMDLLSEGEEPEAALSHAVQVNYAQFESGLSSYLAHNAH